MTRFSELLATNEVHSAYEDVTTTTSTPVPAVKEEVVTAVPTVNFDSMTKDELEDYGRTVGIELDRRHNKKKLIKELEDHIASV
mgnify:CR=1 FL=1